MFPIEIDKKKLKYFSNVEKMKEQALDAVAKIERPKEKKLHRKREKALCGTSKVT